MGMPRNAGDFLAGATQKLRDAGIATARLDCLILLEDVTGRNRAHLLAHPELPLTVEQIGMLHTYLQLRTHHIPLAYIRGKGYFYGREFIVNEHVLVPRPETEAMIDLLKTVPLHKPHVADIGTGSGCIGITAALELPDAKVQLYDIDPLAVMVARQNAVVLRANVTASQADMLNGIADIDIILANLPYVPEKYPINDAATHEPPTALFAGEDGLDDYRSLWKQLQTRTDKPSYVIVESLPVQHQRLAALAKPAGFTQRAVDGFIQLFERA
jgi:release factor glutamine methyltransferase